MRMKRLRSHTLNKDGPLTLKTPKTLSPSSDAFEPLSRTPNTMKTLIEDVKQTAIDKLREGIGDGIDASDLHHCLYNEDYFIIGRHKAKQWLGEDAFEAIERIKNYENEQFGEVMTDFSEPERVANMLPPGFSSAGGERGQPTKRKPRKRKKHKIKLFSP